MDSAIEKNILDNALDALQKQTGLQKKSYRRFVNREGHTDYKLELHAPQETNTRIYRAEIRKNLNSSIISEIALNAVKTTEKFVLITEYGVFRPNPRKVSISFSGFKFVSLNTCDYLCLTIPVNPPK